MTRTSIPVRWRIEARNSRPFSASRTALVAAATTSSTWCDSVRRLNFVSACSAERIVGSVRGTPAESARAKPDHLLLAVDDLERVVGPHLHHDHVYGVGAYVDGGDAHGSDQGCIPCDDGEGGKKMFAIMRVQRCLNDPS